MLHLAYLSQALQAAVLLTKNDIMVVRRYSCALRCDFTDTVVILSDPTIRLAFDIITLIRAMK